MQFCQVVVMVCCKACAGSFAVLALAFASWCIALGGLGSVNWLVCSDYTKTSQDIVDNYIKNFPNAKGNAEELLSKQLSLPLPNTPATNDVALCSRSWRWEWFCMFFEFTIIVSAVVATMASNNRILRARYPLANMLVMASVVIMKAVNDNITQVWWLHDTHKMFNQWAGVLSELYMTAAALVAGWILVVIFNIIWIGFILDCDESTFVKCGAQCAADTRDEEKR